MYQICVRGRLSERLAAALEGMTLHAGAVNTVFTGEVKDQSQLYGLLDRLLGLGLEEQLHIGLVGAHRGIGDIANTAQVTKKSSASATVHCHG
jgi:hypothetical protein